MRLKKTVAAGCFALAVLLLLPGCGDKKNGNPFTGKWAYNHDTSKTALEVSSDGTAKLDGQKYTCELKDDGLILEDENGEKVTVRFKDGEDDKKVIIVYKPMLFISEGKCDGLAGRWNCGRNSFEFTESGTFLEDGYFPGYYLEDTEKGIIRLVYNDMFEDALIPYSLTGEGLLLAYPWEMVKK